MGHLIPAGTGFHQHRDVDIEFTVEEPEPQQDELAEGAENAEGSDDAGEAVAAEEPPLQAQTASAGEESA